MLKTNTRSILTGIVIITLIGLGIYFAKHEWDLQALQSVPAPETTPITEIIDPTAPATAADAAAIPSSPTAPEPAPAPAPATTLNLEMPFFTQAPTGNWDYPWQEACEEASIVMVANVYQNLKLDTNSFNEELLKLVEWQNATFGSYKDTTLAQNAEILKANYGLESVVHENPSFEDIQKILNQGHFIIAPFAGKELGNPNFKNGGPLYHNLVIKGYDADKMQIVTNDVGTRNGGDYVYSWAVIQNALHDWNATDINQGAKRILEVLPPTP